MRAVSARAGAVYALWAAVTTWPLALHLGTAVPGWLGDQALNIWIVDTFWTSVTSGTNPFFTDRIFVPVGANLAQVILGIPVALAAAPFWFWGGGESLVAFFGVMVLAAIVVAGLGMRAVVLTRSGDPHAAFWAGLLYASSPAFLSFIQSPWHFKVAGGALLPWALWALLRWHARPTARRLVALSALTWSLLLLDYYVVGMFLALAIVFVVVAMQRRLVPSILLGLTLNLLLGAVVLQAVPPVDPSDLNLGGGFWGLANANLRDLFVPGWGLTTSRPGGGLPGTGMIWEGVLGHWVGAAAETDYGPDPDSYFLGYGMMALMGVALLRRSSRVTWGVFLGGAFVALLATGTNMRWGTSVLATGIHTPWGWIMQHAPLLQAYDLPRCFMLAGSMALVAVGGLGLARLRWRPLSVGLLAGAIFVLEYARVGIPLTTLPVPVLYRTLAAQGDGRTVLELPAGLVESKGGFGWGGVNSIAMYWQTIHRHPKVAAYVSRVPRSTFNWFARTPVINALMLMTGQQGHAFTDYEGTTWQATALGTYTPEELDHFVRDFRLGYIMFEPDARQAYYRQEVDRVFGARIVQRDELEGFALYRLAE